MSYDLDKDLMCKLVDKYSKKDKIQRADLVEIIVEYESGRATAPNIEYVATPKLPSLSDVQQAVLGYVYSEEEVSLVYDTIKKLGNFTYSRNVR